MRQRPRLFWLVLAGGVAIGGVVLAAPFTGPPHSFQTGDQLSASALNANFAAITAHLNVLEAELAEARAALAALEPSNAQVPPGTIVPFGGDPEATPDGWLPCDGRTLSTLGRPFRESRRWTHLSPMGVIRGRVNRSVNELIDTFKYWKSCRSPDRLGALAWIVTRL